MLRARVAQRPNPPLMIMSGFPRLERNLRRKLRYSDSQLRVIARRMRVCVHKRVSINAYVNVSVSTCSRETSGMTLVLTARSTYHTSSAMNILRQIIQRKRVRSSICLSGDFVFT